MGALIQWEPVHQEHGLWGQADLSPCPDSPLDQSILVMSYK